MAGFTSCHRVGWRTTDGELLVKTVCLVIRLLYLPSPSLTAFWSIGGKDENNSSFVVNLSTTNEPNLCSECAVAHWMCARSCSQRVWWVKESIFSLLVYASQYTMYNMRYAIYNTDMWPQQLFTLVPEIDLHHFKRIWRQSIPWPCWTCVLSSKSGQWVRHCLIQEWGSVILLNRGRRHHVREP